MNTKSLALLSLCLALVGGVIIPVSGAGGPATNTPSAKSVEKPVEVAKSTFVMPRNKNEGRDPFNPRSNRVFDENPNKAGGGKGTGPVVVTDLRLTGIGGTADRRVANINNRAFVKGDDGEMTVGGSKIQIHIIDILEDAVILTVNGEQRELRFRRLFQ